MTAEPFLHHGGRLRAAAKIFPGAPAPWIDLSTGISPFSYPAPRISRNRLPEPEALAALEHAAADCFGVADPAKVVAVPGSDFALRLLPLLLGLCSVGLDRASYGGHEQAWRAAGAAIGSIDDPDVQAVVLVNPNNPDGKRHDREAILDLRNRWVIVDEAFADLDPDISVAGQAGDRLIVLRSFGKFYGLPGLRLGFVIAGQDLASRLRALLGDWPLSVEAIAAGIAAYRDVNWAMRMRRRLARTARRLDGVLTASGFAIAGGTSLFRLAQAENAAARFLDLAELGILVRPLRHAPTRLRFGLPGTSDAWRRLTEALRT